MLKEIEKPIEFGTYINGLRKEKKYSLKIVADKLGICTTLFRPLFIKYFAK
jgi:hypothetical protein